MKNHFLFGYAGNKRKEVEFILKNIKNKIDEIIKSNKEVCIIEPFCGTSAFSYYLSTVYPQKFKYVLNDNSKYLIELYNICKDKDELKIFEEKINKLLKDDFNKDKYFQITSQDNVESYYIKNKIYNIRPGLYRTNYNYNYINMSKCNIVTFLQTEKVNTFNIDAIDIIKQYKNHESNIIFLDPPYLNSCNSFYNNPNTNVYKYIQDNDLKNNEAFFCIVLEKNKIIDLLFEKYYKIEYEKEYEPKHNKTTHLMILNNIDNI